MSVFCRLLLASVSIIATVQTGVAADLSAEELTAPVDPVVVETDGGF